MPLLVHGISKCRHRESCLPCQYMLYKFEPFLVQHLKTKPKMNKSD